MLSITGHRLLVEAAPRIVPGVPACVLSLFLPTLTMPPVSLSGEPSQLSRAVGGAGTLQDSSHIWQQVIGLLTTVDVTGGPHRVRSPDTSGVPEPNLERHVPHRRSAARQPGQEPTLGVAFVPSHRRGHPCTISPWEPQGKARNAGPAPACAVLGGFIFALEATGTRALGEMQVQAGASARAWAIVTCCRSR